MFCKKIIFTYSSIVMYCCIIIFLWQCIDTFKFCIVPSLSAIYMRQKILQYSNISIYWCISKHDAQVFTCTCLLCVCVVDGYESFC